MNTQEKSITKFIINCISIIMIVILWNSFSFGQDTTKKAKDNKPVSNTFNSGIFLENQTYITNGANVFECVINHRFGPLSDGSKTAWGLYDPANIRLGVDYGILKNLQVGIGATKNDFLFDGNLKWGIIKQTKSWSIPVSVSYYGNITINESYFFFCRPCIQEYLSFVLFS